MAGGWLPCYAAGWLQIARNPPPVFGNLSQIRDTSNYAPHWPVIRRAKAKNDLLQAFQIVREQREGESGDGIIADWGRECSRKFGHLAKGEGGGWKGAGKK
jgi:hypothetical protein